MRVFREVTVAQCVLDDPRTAQREVRRVLAAAARHKRPVYIEMPRDCALASIVDDGAEILNATSPSYDADKALLDALGMTLREPFKLGRPQDKRTVTA